MATLNSRITALEQKTKNNLPLVLFVDSRPSAAQQAEIDTAIQVGRTGLIFLQHSDTAWVVGAGVPPWEQQEVGEYHGK